MSVEGRRRRCGPLGLALELAAPTGPQATVDSACLPACNRITGLYDSVMRTKAPTELPIFRSELQARLLTLLLLDPDARWSSRELRERTRASQSSLHRELHRLEAAGLIDAERVGRAHLYGAASDSPAFEPLRELVLRTSGVEEQLRRSLMDVPGIEAAAIFGSWARGDIAPDSDVDVLVVGEPDFGELAGAVRAVEQASAREVNLTTLRGEELRERLKEGSGFASELFSDELRILIGSMEPYRAATA